MSLIALAGAAGLGGAAVCGGPEPSRTGADTAQAPANGSRSIGRHSRSSPPRIARTQAGTLVSASEMERVFSRWRAAVCERVEVNSRSIADPEAVLGLSVTEVAPVKIEAFATLSEDGVARRAGPGVAEWLSGLALSREQPCAVLAAITLLHEWPEAEPGDLLADLVRDPPGGSVYLTIIALSAMGETGRADYVDVLSTFVDPANDSRVVAKAIRAAAVITGDAQLALDLARNETFPVDEALAFAMARSLGPAEGPTLDLTMKVLLESTDPFRQDAGLRAAALGAGMPAALPRVIAAAADPDLSLGAARHAVTAIQHGMPGSAAPVLLDLARNDSASPDASAAAFIAIADAPLEVGLRIAGRQPTPVLLVGLAEHAERLRQGGALSIFQAAAAASAPREPLVAAIRGASDERLTKAGQAAFPDPGLWE